MKRCEELKNPPAVTRPFAIVRAVAFCSLLLTSPTSVLAQSSFPSPPFREDLLSEKTVKVSDHVWAIIGFPNIGIVVGATGTLVVDTGLGRRNGSTVARTAKRLAPHNRLFLTTTHFHPEHAAGVLGFPPETILIRNRVQQEEIDAHGEEMIRLFASQNSQWKSLLAGAQLRAPDEIFERELRLNLGGGVTARLLWYGAAHTRGDELVFVDPDKTLISGDIVQNKVGPYIDVEGGTAASWISAVDEAAKLGVQHVVPDHSPIGDGSLVAQESTFLNELKERARQCRSSRQTDDGRVSEQVSRPADRRYDRICESGLR
jgi:glyoxylase-like metal-dependent hydrolase (beta-lactamase superfamily II)